METIADVPDRPKGEEVEPEIPRYSPWPEDKVYRPGEGDAPAQRGRLAYGEAPEVGDLPRQGPRPGDPRWSDWPEKAAEFQFEGKVMPGLPAEELNKKDPLTGMPYRYPHPLMTCSKEMNTGRGCDAYGRAYDAPPRYERIQVFKFDDDDGGYRFRKEYELDFGPSKESPEFKSAMQALQDTPEFQAWERQKKAEEPDWAWRDPVELKPWEQVEKVDPNPWLAEQVPKEPVEDHAEKIHAWAKQEHEPWPAAPVD